MYAARSHRLSHCIILILGIWSLGFVVGHINRHLCSNLYTFYEDGTVRGHFIALICMGWVFLPTSFLLQTHLNLGDLGNSLLFLMYWPVLIVLHALYFKHKHWVYFAGIALIVLISFVDVFVLYDELD